MRVLSGHEEALASWIGREEALVSWIGREEALASRIGRIEALASLSGREEALASIRQALFYGRAFDSKKAAIGDDSSLLALLPALGAQLAQLPMFIGELTKK